MTVQWKCNNCNKISKEKFPISITFGYGSSLEYCEVGDQPDLCSDKCLIEWCLKQKELRK